MRITVMSDSHGSMEAVQKVIEKNLSLSNVFIHLGDGEKELEFIKMLYPRAVFYSVAGNCDYSSTSKIMDVIEIGGIKILAVHGHKHNVRYGVETLKHLARENECTVALFGHTHCRFQTYEDGIYLLNPGSCFQPRDNAKPSYGFIDITSRGVLTNIVSL